MGNQITCESIQCYRGYLQKEERSKGTIEKYMRDIRDFFSWISGRDVTKELAAEWKEHLINSRYAAVTVNSKLSVINGFFHFMGWESCRVKFLRVQRRMFRDQSKDLSRVEYKRLLDAANSQGKERLALILETICGTGIRVSELKYITVEAVRQGCTEISLKGKIRTILLPGKLCRKLLKYTKKQNRSSGEIFITKNGNSLSRRQIWAEMKKLCKHACVEPGKVFPHNLRHLFARAYYRVCKDIIKVADVLGHSSIDTTRIYLVSTGAEHARQLERLNLID